jgi:hypothetical protein
MAHITMLPLWYKVIIFQQRRVTTSKNTDLSFQLIQAVRLFYIYI